MSRLELEHVAPTPGCRGDEGTVRPEILAQEGVRDEETAIARVGREFLCFRACCGGPFADLDVDVLGVGKKLAADATRLRQCRENVARQGQEAAAGSEGRVCVQIRQR